MDPEKLKRRQSIKVIASEALMTLSVIITVVALAFIVSGYWVNSDFEIERQGLLQISSFPTGADVTIDGDTAWLQRTNTSKVLKSGEHQITLTKDGYDSWAKAVNISEGLLYRVRYPRLFLKERKKETLLNQPGITYASASPSGEVMLLIKETTVWDLVQLDNDSIKSKPLDIKNYFTNTNGNIFTAKISSVDWSSDNSHVLIQATSDVSSEWVLIDINKPENSLNLTKLFDASFNDMHIIDSSASNLLVLRDGNLHKINTSSKSISAVLISGVMSYDYYRNEVVLSRKKTEAPENEPEFEQNYELVLFNLSNDRATILQENTSSYIVSIDRFYDDIIITTVNKNTVSLYKKEDFKLLSGYELSFNPDDIRNSSDSEFIVISNDQSIATIDMESSTIKEWSIDGQKCAWLGGSMLYSVSDGKLYVYDADGLNRRLLSENVSSYFPVTITKNKWLHYFSDNSLIREIIAE